MMSWGGGRFKLVDAQQRRFRGSTGLVDRLRAPK
jgi:hypothetical protein